MSKLKLRAFKASKGDSFALSWISKSNTKHQILIDCGIGKTYPEIRRYLQSESYLDGLIITHVDYDHLGGLFKLINDSNPPVDLIFPVYINTPELIISPDTTGLVNIEHGIKLSKILDEKAIEKRSLYTGVDPNNTIEINDLKIVIISPSLEIINKFKEVWTANKLYQNFLDESKVNGNANTETGNLKSHMDVLKEKEVIHKWDSDLINSSSIAFIAQLNEIRILFLGDANPEVIADQLENYHKITNKNKLKVDLVKISHHGSKFNTSKRLLQLLDSNSFLISTSGEGPYYHPDKETIIRISEYGRDSKDKIINIYTNYDLSSRLLINSEDETQNVNIIPKTEFEYE